jgi:hypothetical protein
MCLLIQLLQKASNRRMTAQAGLGKKRDSSSKITRAKRAGGMAQVVEQTKTQYCQKKKKKVF